MTYITTRTWRIPGDPVWTLMTALCGGSLEPFRKRHHNPPMVEVTVRRSGG